MKVGKLCTIGECVGVVVPAQYRKQLGWLKGDQIAQEILGNTIVLHNVTQHMMTLTTHRKAYGDGAANPSRRIREIPVH